VRLLELGLREGVRISKIEIIGTKRMNRNSRVENRPSVPKNVEKSQKVG